MVFWLCRNEVYRHCILAQECQEGRYIFFIEETFVFPVVGDKIYRYIYIYKGWQSGALDQHKLNIIRLKLCGFFVETCIWFLLYFAGTGPQDPITQWWSRSSRSCIKQDFRSGESGRFLVSRASLRTRAVTRSFYFQKKSLVHLKRRQASGHYTFWLHIMMYRYILLVKDNLRAASNSVNLLNDCKLLMKHRWSNNRLMI